MGDRIRERNDPKLLLASLILSPDLAKFVKTFLEFLKKTLTPGDDVEYLAIPTKLFEPLGEKITDFRWKLMLMLRYGPAARNLGDDAVAPPDGRPSAPLPEDAQQVRAPLPLRH